MTNDAPSPQTQSGRFGFVTRHLLGLIILAVAVVFILENTAKVRVRAVVPEVTAPLWEILVATLVAGMLILALVQRRRRR